MDNIIGIAYAEWRELRREIKTLAGGHDDVDPDKKRFARRLTNMSLWTSWRARGENRQFGEAVATTEVQDPVFILGHWRSGTTLFHNLMALDEQFAYPRIYQVSNPHSFLRLPIERIMERQARASEARKRPMDNVEFDLQSAAEDEFATCPMSIRSHMIAWSFFRQEPYYDRFLTFRDAPREDYERWRKSFVWFLKKVVYKYGCCRPLLKSPQHTGRVRLLLEQFPNARFIHVRRNPYVVFRSTQRLYETGILPHAFQASPSTDFAVDGILRRYKELYDAFFEDRALIPAGHYTELAFEDLEQDMLGCVARAYEAVGLDGYAQVGAQAKGVYRIAEGLPEEQAPADRRRAPQAHLLDLAAGLRRVRLPRLSVSLLRHGISYRQGDGMQEPHDAQAPEKLFNRNFLLQWQGQTVSRLGSQIFMAGLLFWIKGATGSPALMGTIAMVSSLPGVILMPVGGALADRYPRRVIIILGDLIRGLSLLALTSLMVLRPQAIPAILAGLFIVSVINGIIGSFFGPALAATIPDLVPKARVTAANSLGQLSLQGSLFIGQALGGWLFEVVGAAWLFLINSLSFLYSSGSEVLVKIPQTIPERKGNWKEQFRTFGREIVDGFRYVWAKPGLREMLLLSAALELLHRAHSRADALLRGGHAQCHGTVVRLPPVGVRGGHRARLCAGGRPPPPGEPPGRGYDLDFGPRPARLHRPGPGADDGRGAGPDGPGRPGDRLRNGQHHCADPGDDTQRNTRSSRRLARRAVQRATPIASGLAGIIAELTGKNVPVVFIVMRRADRGRRHPPIDKPQLPGYNVDRVRPGPPAAAPASAAARSKAATRVSEM